MRSMVQRLFAAAALAVLVTGTSCGDAVRTPTETQAARLVAIPFVVRLTPAAEETAEVVIDERGGDVRVGGHVLFVPNGAVAESTRFTMQVIAGPFVQVSLSAKRVSDNRAVETFPLELRLRMNYRDAVVVQESRLGVAYLIDGTTHGRREPTPASVDVFGKFVEARLTHFSTYALVID